ncbi:MAG: hypothetical protein ACRYG4_26140, partial [Janthinobacterium lividum]
MAITSTPPQGDFLSGMRVALAMTPADAGALVIAIASVVIGTFTKRILAAAKGEPQSKWLYEFGLIPVEVIIAEVLSHGFGVSGLASVTIGVVVGNAGGPFVDRWLRSNQPNIPTPPSDAITPRNASPEARRELTARESPIANYGSKITP